MQSANPTCSSDLRQSTFATNAASCVAAGIVATIATVISVDPIFSKRIEPLPYIRNDNFKLVVFNRRNRRRYFIEAIKKLSKKVKPRPYIRGDKFRPVSLNRIYFNRAIKKLELVKAFVFKKDSVFKTAVCKDLIFSVFQFIEPIDFDTEISLEAELFSVERPGAQDVVVMLLLSYLAKKFLEDSMPKGKETINRLYTMGREFKAQYAPNCKYLIFLKTDIQTATKLVGLLDNEQSIFGLFKLYLVRVLSLDSTFAQFRNEILIPQYIYILTKAHFRKRLRKYLQDLLDLDCSELRKILTLLIGPRQVIIFLIKACIDISNFDLKI